MHGQLTNVESLTTKLDQIQSSLVASKTVNNGFNELCDIAQQAFMLWISTEGENVWRSSVFPFLMIISISSQLLEVFWRRSI